MKRPASTVESKDSNKIQKLSHAQLKEFNANIFSNEGITDIKFNSIDRLIESNSSYQALLNLRRASHWYCNAIDQRLTKTLNERYKSEDYISGGFQILESAPIVFQEGMPVTITSGIPRCLAADLQQALVLYFHAQRNYRQAACLAFINLFESHLKSFKSHCQDSNFQYDYVINQGEKKFTLACNQFEQLEIKVNTPFSAYLFSHFVHRFLTSNQCMKFIFAPLNHNPLMPIIGFLQLYKSFNGVTSTVEVIIHKLLPLMQPNPFNSPMPNNASYISDIETIRLCSSTMLQKIVEHGLIDKQLAIKGELIEKIISRLPYNTVPGRQITLSFYAKCAELGLIDSALSTKLHLVEKIAASLDAQLCFDALICLRKFAKKGLINTVLVFDLAEKIRVFFSHAHPKIWNEAWTCMGTFVEKGLIDSSLEEKLKLIEKIASQLPWQGTLFCLRECANKDLIKHVHLTWLNLNEKLAFFLSHPDLLIQREAFSCMSTFATKGLISLHYLKDLNLIETIASFLSSKDVFFQKGALFCMNRFAEKGLIDLSLVTNHNLIEKIASLLPQIHADFAKVYLVDLSLATKLQLVEKIASRLTSPFLDAIICLLIFLEKKLIDRSLITTLNLLAIAIIGFDFYMSKKNYFQCGVVFFCLIKLAENGFIDPSAVTKHNLVERIRSFLLITQFNVNKHASDCLKIFEDKGLINGETDLMKK